MTRSWSGFFVGGNNTLQIKGSFLDVLLYKNATFELSTNGGVNMHCQSNLGGDIDMFLSGIVVSISLRRRDSFIDVGRNVVVAKVSKIREK